MSIVRAQLVSECYNYCGFSFFPALPWKAMEVPLDLPHPQMLMLAGLFEFGGVDTHFWTFVGSALAIPLSGACLLYTSPSPRDATLSRMPSSA